LFAAQFVYDGRDREKLERLRKPWSEQSVEGTGAVETPVMKSKIPPGRRVRQLARHAAGPTAQGGRAVILDFIQSRIEAFNQEHGGGVSVRKDPRGYTLIREDDAVPVARLRPANQGQFEVLHWNPYNDRWRPVGAFGTCLPLEDALEFIAEDPMDCFWR
jgi:hypothetical protein